MIIDAKKGKGNKIHVSVDDEYIFTVDADCWYSLGIPSGNEINDEELEALKNVAGSRRAYNKALDLMTRRDYCEKELYARLCRNFDNDSAQQAVRKVKNLGLINDEAYAQRLAAEMYDKKYFSPSRIRSELIFRGISREIADKVIEGIDNEQKERIIKILRLKFESQLITERGRNKAFNSLARLGYQFDEIRSAMRDFDADLPDDY